MAVQPLMRAPLGQLEAAVQWHRLRKRHVDHPDRQPLAVELAPERLDSEPRHPRDPHRLGIPIPLPVPAVLPGLATSSEGGPDGAAADERRPGYPAPGSMLEEGG